MEQQKQKEYKDNKKAIKIRARRYRRRMERKKKWTRHEEVEGKNMKIYYLMLYYLLTYLFTYLLHGAESFLRS
jgi:hypothetical protein